MESSNQIFMKILKIMEMENIVNAGTLGALGPWGSLGLVDFGSRGPLSFRVSWASGTLGLVER